MKVSICFVAALMGAMVIFGDVAAAELEYRSADEFVKSLSSTPAIDQVVEGDLNADGLSDRAILAGQQEPKIYILLQMPSGSFFLAQESKVGSIMYTEVDLTIKNGSLHVSLSHAVNGIEQGDYQFKLYKGNWRMIGLNHYISDPNQDQTVDQSINTDFNLLTGDVIFKRGKTDRESAKTTSTSTREKAVGSPCLLADFDFDFLFCVGNWKTGKGLSVSGLMLP